MSSARLCHKQVGQAMQWSWKNVWGRTAQRLVAQAASVDVPAPPDRATDSTAPLDEAYGASKIQVRNKFCNSAWFLSLNACSTERLSILNLLSTW